MSVFFKPESELVEARGLSWVGYLLMLIFLGVGAALVFTAPELNNRLFKNNKKMVPLTGSLWILSLPASGTPGGISEKTLLKFAEPRRPGGPKEETAPGMMYLSRFKDGLIRPRFFFDDLPQSGPSDQQSMLSFRYRVDNRPEQKTMAVLQGRQVLMLLPTEGGFEDLGPKLVEAAARGRKLQVSLELKPDWIFEAIYDVSEMTIALDQFKKERDSL